MELTHYLGLLDRSLGELARAYREVAGEHGDEPDVVQECRLLAGRCDDHGDALGPIADRYGEDAEARTLDLLEKTLGAKSGVPTPVQDKLLTTLPQDVADLLPHLQERADEHAKRAKQKLVERGDREAKEMADILEAQRRRIDKALKENPQRVLEFDDLEKRQLEAKRHQMRFAHETDFQSHLRRLDDRGKYAAGITFAKLGCHSECSKCNARHAVRIDVLGQGTGNFTLELLQHGRETFRLLGVSGCIAIDVLESLQ